MKRLSVWLSGAMIVFFALASVYAASLTHVRDLISTSAPNTGASHTLQFTATRAVPASGKVVITFEDGAFNIPSNMNVSDIDVSVASSGPYIDRSVASSSGASEDGVAFVTGTSGSIIITLNSTTGISAGEHVRITLGTEALSGGVGTNNIVNPSSVGSYRIHLVTKDQVDDVLDSADAMIAIVQPVSLRASSPTVAPVRFNGLPSGEIAAGNSSIEISLETVDAATCRYATSSDVVYESMLGTFSPSVGTLFYTTISGHQNSTTYNYYVRCINSVGDANLFDYVISFSLKDTPTSNTSIPGEGTPSTNGQSGYLGPGGVGTYPNGSSVLYLASVTISGWTSPSAQVTILKDGGTGTSVRAGSDGNFSGAVTGLERGTYTFQVYSEDSRARKSATHSSTMSLTSGSDNAISNVVISPTIEMSNDAIGVGEPLVLKGEGLLGSRVEVMLTLQSEVPSPADIHTFSASTTGAGLWEMTIDTTKLPKGTYSVKARVSQSDRSKSDYSTPMVLGIGAAAPSDASLRADINKDGKVNLVDFSILLSNWGGTDADSDINQDGAINLADFSIQLFYWTG